MDVCMYVCLYVCMYVCMFVYTMLYVRMHVCMYVCMCIRIYMCVCMYVCVYVCMTTTFLAGCSHSAGTRSNTPQKTPKPVTFISPGAWLSLELLPGLPPPELQDLRLPVLAPDGGVATCQGRPLPLPAAIRL